MSPTSPTVSLALPNSARGRAGHLILPGTLSAVLIALAGAFYFRRLERIFADVA